MSDYYARFLEELLKGDLERRTNLKTGAEALYRDGKLLLSDTADSVAQPDLVEDIKAEPHIVMFGAGHVGKAVYDLAAMLDMKITVLDDRPELMGTDRFPEAERIVGDYSELLNRDYPQFLSPYYLIFTHGHSADSECLYYAVKHQNSYVGMIGSKAKIAHCLEVVRQKGATDKELEDLHSPVGLSINAVTPQEIAVAIMAEIISVFRSNKKAITIDPKILQKAATEPGIMVRITEKNGSAPRSVGSMMFVTENDFIGTIGGGSIESHAIDRAKQMLRDSESLLTEQQLLSESGMLGMVCGGGTSLLYKKV